MLTAVSDRWCGTCEYTEYHQDLPAASSSARLSDGLPREDEPWQYRVTRSTDNSEFRV